METYAQRANKTTVNPELEFHDGLEKYFRSQLRRQDNVRVFLLVAFSFLFKVSAAMLVVALVAHFNDESFSPWLVTLCAVVSASSLVYVLLYGIRDTPRSELGELVYSLFDEVREGTVVRRESEVSSGGDARCVIVIEGNTRSGRVRQQERVVDAKKWSDGVTYEIGTMCNFAPDDSAVG